MSLPTVYGVALNDKSERLELGAEFAIKPYQAPPNAPVMYIKTCNTFAIESAAVAVGSDEVKIDATIGVVLAYDAKGLVLDNALEAIAGYLVVSDLTIAHQSYYRPAISQRCRDGFCPMSEVIVPQHSFVASDSTISIYVNDHRVHERHLSSLVRGLAQLLVDVTEFMTLSKGDVLLVGLPHNAPTAKAGDSVRIEVSGLGVLKHTLVHSAGVAP